MKTALMVMILAAMLIAAWLVARDVTSRQDQKATISAIDKARAARDKAGEAGRQMEKTLDGALRE